MQCNFYQDKAGWLLCVLSIDGSLACPGMHSNIILNRCKNTDQMVSSRCDWNNNDNIQDGLNQKLQRSVDVSATVSRTCLLRCAWHQSTSSQLLILWRQIRKDALVTLQLPQGLNSLYWNDGLGIYICAPKEVTWNCFSIFWQRLLRVHLAALLFCFTLTLFSDAGSCLLVGQNKPFKDVMLSYVYKHPAFPLTSLNMEIITFISFLPILSSYFIL